MAARPARSGAGIAQNGEGARFVTILSASRATMPDADNHIILDEHAIAHVAVVTDPGAGQDMGECPDARAVAAPQFGFHGPDHAGFAEGGVEELPVFGAGEKVGRRVAQGS